MSAVAPTREFRIHGRHVLFGVVAFFALVIGVDAVFMTLAIRTFPGQVTDRPFEDGLAYNRVIAKREAQAKLGFTALAETAPGAVVVHMRDHAGAPLQGLSLSALLSRPAAEAGRRELRFVETEPGLYRAEAAAVAGTWDLSLTARTVGGDSFDAERRLTWR